jgi:hypothetical protein
MPIFIIWGRDSPALAGHQENNPVTILPPVMVTWPGNAKPYPHHQDGDRGVVIEILK